MRKFGLAFMALIGVSFFASSAAADDRWYGYCKVTDHSTLSVFSAIYYTVPARTADFEAAYLDRTERRNTFSGEVYVYCYNYQAREQVEAELAKKVAAVSGERVMRDPLDPSTLPALSGPTLGNAKAFLKETLLNGVSRVHPMRASDTMNSDGYVVKDVSGGRCDSTIVYIGDWFNRPEAFSLEIDWTKAGDVSPFYIDPARSHIKVLAATIERKMGVPTAISGVSINTGSESMEARLTKALQVIVEACRPKSSTGF